MLLCSFSKTGVILHCLLLLTICLFLIYLFLKKQYFQSPFGFPTVFGPRVDGDLLPDEPEVLATTGSYRNVDLISGYTSDDGAEMLGK